MGRKVNSVLLLAAAACVAACCIGCDDGSLDRTGKYVSYISTNTEVYSSTAEMVAAVADTVVEIRTESTVTQWGMQYVVSGAGSGVIVAHADTDKSIYYIITNNHVIEGARDIHVSLRSGVTYDAELIATDVRGDVAVIAIEENETLNRAVWGNSDSLKVGEDVVAIGNPLGSLGGTVTKGIISSKARNIAVGNHTMTLLQTDTAINPGNSGGGLFNMRGELIGIVNAKTSDEEVEGICFAIPANTARAIYGDLVEYGAVRGRASLGIEVATVGTNMLCVTSAGNSPANTFMQYDRIYKIGDREITSLLAYNDAVAELVPGDDVQVTVYRGRYSGGGFFGQTLTFDANPTTFTVKAGGVAL